MCGIVGYVGPDQALPILIEGLRRLEYRGYDSAGVAVLDGGVGVVKRAGKLSALEEALEGSALSGRVGVGHTRWATHGAPTDRNAHPHTDCTGRLAVIHNGIIENHQALRDRLEKSGHAFASDTDTECIAHLLEEHFRRAPRRRRARGRQGAGGRLRDRRRVGRRPRADRRRQGILAAHRGPGRRGGAARLRHPRGAGSDPHRHSGGRGPGGRADPRRGLDHRLRRQPGRPGADHRRLGHRPGPEGRLRRLHAEGDPRAARRPGRHPARPDRRRGPPRAR